jgi:hypothetical protein
MTKLEKEVKEKFHKFFLKLKKVKKLNPEIEEIIWIHLVAIKHNTPELFEQGIKHFGIK